MSRPVAFCRYDADGVSIDRRAQPTSGDGVDLLLNVWAGRLNRGEYSRIVLKLENGGFATLKRKS